MATGSESLDRIVERLGSTDDPKRRYQYVLWLAKKLAPLPEDFRQESFKVKGCVSQVYVVGQLVDGKLHWLGDSDAQITKGLLALLIEGMEGLPPERAAQIDPGFICRHRPAGQPHPIAGQWLPQHLQKHAGPGPSAGRSRGHARRPLTPRR
jgi:cysteine desulfuration protein SufE